MSNGSSDSKVTTLQDSADFEITPYGRRRKRNMLHAALAHLMEILSPPLVRWYHRLMRHPASK